MSEFVCADPGTYRQDGAREVELRTGHGWWHVVVLDFAFEATFETSKCD